MSILKENTQQAVHTSRDQTSNQSEAEANNPNSSRNINSSAANDTAHQNKSELLTPNGEEKSTGDTLGIASFFSKINFSIPAVLTAATWYLLASTTQLPYLTIAVLSGLSAGVWYGAVKVAQYVVGLAREFQTLMSHVRSISDKADNQTNAILQRGDRLLCEAEHTVKEVSLLLSEVRTKDKQALLDQVNDLTNKLGDVTEELKREMEALSKKAEETMNAVNAGVDDAFGGGIHFSLGGGPSKRKQKRKSSTSSTINSTQDQQESSGCTPRAKK